MKSKTMNLLRTAVLGSFGALMVYGCVNRNEAQNVTTDRYPGYGYDLRIDNGNAQMYGFDINKDGTIDEAIFVRGSYCPGTIGNVSGATTGDTIKWKHLVTNEVNDTNAYFKTTNTREMTPKEKQMFDDIYSFKINGYIRPQTVPNY